LQRITSVVAVIALSLVGVGCSKKDKPASVDVTEMDFKIQPSATSAKNGKVEFHVKNNGPSTHEFVVVASDLAPDAVPLKGNVIDEEKTTPVDELENLAKDSTTTLKVTLKKGKYVLICNVAGHYQSGMHVGFTAT
jgi:uncharacterized cupredoxin-like copper-binding protein